MENTERNIRLFIQLLSCVHDISFFTLDSHLNIIYSNHTDDRIPATVFMLDESHPAVLNTIRETRMASVITDALDFFWIADPAFDDLGELLYIHVLGPVFVEEVSFRKIEQSLSVRINSMEIKREFMEYLQRVPVIPITRFLEYGLMLHYCITGEKISLSDFAYPKTRPSTDGETPQPFADAYSTWAVEQKMMRMIEEGNLEFVQQMTKMGSGLDLGEHGNGDSLRHMKNMIIISVALCTRAAIRGGLDADIAYHLSAAYIRGVEACASFAEVADINVSMQNDFVTRVHRIKANQGMFPQIKKCCDYIQMNIEKKITVSELAKACGYSETHLSRRFKQETGMTISAYILKEKIACAKSYLSSSSKPVQEIAARLGFESQSYFGEQFRKQEGMTPGQYRQRHETAKH